MNVAAGHSVGTLSMTIRYHVTRRASFSMWLRPAFARSRLRLFALMIRRPSLALVPAAFAIVTRFLHTQRYSTVRCSATPLTQQTTLTRRTLHLRPARDCIRLHTVGLHLYRLDLDREVIFTTLPARIPRPRVAGENRRPTSHTGTYTWRGSHNQR